MGKRSAAKRWCFTDYKDTFEYDEATMEYLIYGREVCPTTGRKHLQGFVCFKQQKRLSALKKMSNGTHWEVARGSVADNDKYCSKEGDFVTFGTRPLEQGVKGGEARRLQYVEAYNHAQQGEFDAIEASILLHCYGNIKRIHQDFILSRPLCNLVPDSVCGLWLCGPPGIGKSYYARELAANAGLSIFSKPLNKWWDGYTNEDLVLLEDVDHFSSGHIGAKLKIWTDEYVFVGEVKGGSIKLRPRGIIVTSNYSIDELWPNDFSFKQALHRRFLQPPLGCREDLKSGWTWVVPEHVSPTVSNVPEEAADVNESCIEIVNFSEDMFE